MTCMTNGGETLRKFILITSCVLFCWLLFVYVFGTPWPWKLVQAKQESTEYLQEKYHEEFEVKWPRFWIMDGTFHAEASPKAGPHIVFSVGTEQGEEGIQDNYQRIHE